VECCELAIDSILAAAPLALELARYAGANLPFPLFSPPVRPSAHNRNLMTNNNGIHSLMRQFEQNKKIVLDVRSKRYTKNNHNNY
jgi:hypothetical protein